jgi:laminin G domain protein
MGSRRTLVVMAATAVVVLGTATSADARSGYQVASWQLNERNGARTMIDDSGHGLDGTIGGEVGTDVHGDGAIGYRFAKLDPDTPPTHPRHLVTVADSDELNPGTRDFAVTVRLRTTYQFGNIIQKGQATVRGGNFKMQIPNGIVECVFRGANGTMLVASTHRLNDGQWHTVRCDRGYDGLELTVDGSPDAARRGWTGVIENDWPLAIGGKTDCDQVHVGCDYYAGDLDYVRIDAG